MLLKGAYCVGEHFVDPHSLLVVGWEMCSFYFAKDLVNSIQDRGAPLVYWVEFMT